MKQHQVYSQAAEADLDGVPTVVALEVAQLQRTGCSSQIAAPEASFYNRTNRQACRQYRNRLLCVNCSKFLNNSNCFYFLYNSNCLNCSNNLYFSNCFYFSYNLPHFLHLLNCLNCSNNLYNLLILLNCVNCLNNSYSFLQFYSTINCANCICNYDV